MRFWLYLMVGAGVYLAMVIDYKDRCEKEPPINKGASYFVMSALWPMTLTAVGLSKLDEPRKTPKPVTCD